MCGGVSQPDWMMNGWKGSVAGYKQVICRQFVECTFVVIPGRWLQVIIDLNMMGQGCMVSFGYDYHFSFKGIRGDTGL